MRKRTFLYILSFILAAAMVAARLLWQEEVAVCMEPVVEAFLG